MITFDDFQKLDLRVAKIEKVEEVEGSDKLYKLKIDIGNEKRQIVAGIKDFYNPKELKGKRIIVVANLEPKTVFGVESQGMLLAADAEGPVLLVPDKEVKPGTKIR